MSEILRTPDERFENLPGFPYKPNYLEGTPYEVQEAGHFVQEWGEEIAEKALAFFSEKEQGK